MHTDQMIFERAIHLKLIKDLQEYVLNQKCFKINPNLSKLIFERVMILLHFRVNDLQLLLLQIDQTV